MSEYSSGYWLSFSGEGLKVNQGLSFFFKLKNLRPWSSWTADSDKKYMELNGAALNVNKPCVTSPKTAFPKDK